jgi:hypothetical protein
VTALIDEISQASAGLLFPSESDAPVQPFVWQEQQPFSIAALRRAQGYTAGTLIATLDVDTFFGAATRAYDWHGPAEQERAERFRALVELLNVRLRALAAYKVGESGTLDVFVVGQVDDGTWAGVRTQVVET